MDNSFSSSKIWGGLDLGIHVCSIYRNSSEQFSPLVPFFSEGLSKKQKCLYVFDENTPERVYSELAQSQAGFGDTSDLRNTQMLSRQETYLKDGVFDPEKVIKRFGDTLRSSLDEGYTGIRVAGEMSWAIASKTPVEKLIDYEVKLNSFFPTNKLTGVCLFDEEKFDPDLLANMIRTHPYVVLYGKLYQNKYFYTDPEFGTNLPERLGASEYKTILSFFLEDDKSN